MYDVYELLSINAMQCLDVSWWGHGSHHSLGYTAWHRLDVWMHGHLFPQDIKAHTHPLLTNHASLHRSAQSEQENIDISFTNQRRFIVADTWDSFKMNRTSSAHRCTHIQSISILSPLSPFISQFSSTSPLDSGNNVWQVKYGNGVEKQLDCQDVYRF